VPRLPIEHLIAQLVDKASEIVTAQDRLRMLLRANRSIVGELSLSGVLQRIVEAAQEVSGAKYAALGVIGPDGLHEQFVQVGVDEEAAAKIGRLPEGHGVLGALIKDPVPIRVSDLRDDPRFSGHFPEHHPVMTTFLGVPIRSHDEVFGNLYLTDKLTGNFTAQDEEFILALAATASIAVENARLYEESRQRQEWLRASGEISRRLLDPDQDQNEILQRIAESVKRLSGADVVLIVLPAADPAMVEVAVATGDSEHTLRGQRFAIDGSLVETAIMQGRGVLGDSAPDRPLTLQSAVFELGPVMTFPLIGEGTTRGAIIAGRRTGRRAFAAADLDMAEAFASHATIALELSDARTDQERLAVLEDRDRIAQDLHDHVIQRLFATGLSVQVAARLADEPELRERLARSATELDDTIQQIRTSIFELREDNEPESLRRTVLSIVRQVSPLLPNEPDVELSGPLDSRVDSMIVADAGAVVREALTNVVKHARAERVGVTVELTSEQLSIIVDDDGIGIPADATYSGLANLRHRAERRSGELMISQSGPGGTRVRWTVPLDPR
jgi:signal transduction histidine kinase